MQKYHSHFWMIYRGCSCLIWMHKEPLASGRHIKGFNIPAMKSHPNYSATNTKGPPVHLDEMQGSHDKMFRTLSSMCWYVYIDCFFFSPALFGDCYWVVGSGNSYTNCWGSLLAGMFSMYEKWGWGECHTAGDSDTATGTMVAVMKQMGTFFFRNSDVLKMNLK